MAMPPAYGTRYRGRRVPTTVEMEAKNNAMLGDEGRIRRKDSEDTQWSNEDLSDSDDDYDERAEAAWRRKTARARPRHSSRKGGAGGHHHRGRGHHVSFHSVATGEEPDSDEDPEYATAKALVMQGRGPGPPPGWASPTAALTAAIPELPVEGGEGGLMYRNVHMPRRQFLPVSAPPIVPPHPLYHAVKPPGAPSAAARASAGSDDGKRNTWTADEDKILASLVAKYGPKKWGIIASYLPGRNAKQCHQRWHYVLTPQISRDTWTPREDYIIYHYHLIMGNKWSHIAKHLPGRTGYAVRNRQAFLDKHYKGKAHAPKIPADMPQHELDAIRAAAAKSESEPPKASGRSSRKVKAEAGGSSITERLHLQIPVAMEARLRSPEDVLAKAVPAEAASHVHQRHRHHPHHHHHHPNQWSSDPPRSPLDLLASLPQIDMSFAAPHSHHQQHHLGDHAPGSPVMTPRTQIWFETTFPNIGSPLPSASSLHHQPLPTHAPPSASATPTGAASTNLRFPVDAGLGAPGYWIPSVVHGGECAGEGGGHGRDPLRLRHFGHMGETYSPQPSPRDVYLYQQAMAEHQHRHEEHEHGHAHELPHEEHAAEAQGKAWGPGSTEEQEGGGAAGGVGGLPHLPHLHHHAPLFSSHAFMMERGAEGEHEEEQGGVGGVSGGVHELHRELHHTDREAGPGPASGVGSSLEIALGLSGAASSSKGSVPPTPSPTTTIGVPRASPFRDGAGAQEADAAMDTKPPAPSALAQAWRDEEEEEYEAEAQMSGRGGMPDPIPSEEEEEETEEVESGREYGVYMGGVGGEVDEKDEENGNEFERGVSEDRSDHYRVKRPKL